MQEDSFLCVQILALWADSVYAPPDHANGHTYMLII
jgi:hypothetical protein